MGHPVSAKFQYSLLIWTSRYAKDGESEDAAVALLATAIEKFSPRVEQVPPVDELVGDVRAEIHRVPRLGRPDQQPYTMVISIHPQNPKIPGF